MFPYLYFRLFFYISKSTILASRLTVLGSSMLSAILAMLAVWVLGRHCTVTKSWSLPSDPSSAQRLDITPTLSTLPWEVYVEYNLHGSAYMLGQVLATDIRRGMFDLMESPGGRRFYHWKSPPGRFDISLRATDPAIPLLYRDALNILVYVANSVERNERPFTDVTFNAIQRCHVVCSGIALWSAHHFQTGEFSMQNTSSLTTP